MRPKVALAGGLVVLAGFVLLFLHSTWGVILILSGPFVLLVGLILPKPERLPLMAESLTMQASALLLVMGFVSLAASFASFLTNSPNHTLESVLFVLPFVLIPAGAILPIFAIVRDDEEQAEGVGTLDSASVTADQTPPAPPAQDASPYYQPVVQVREREIIREIVKIPCRNCGTLVELTLMKCPSCGAPLR